ncbi:MAG TPA: hypothetical protein PK248_04145 [Treponemataceae bacterium]|nr:hypothetical protein [Treponemataceae bacterium]
MTEQKFTARELEEGLGTFFTRGFSHIRVEDSSLTENKQALLAFLRSIAKKEGQVLFEFFLSVEMLEKDIVNALAETASTLVISFNGGEQKNFAKKIALLNDLGLSFGFIVELNEKNTETKKLFSRLLEEIAGYFPNHVYFSFENSFASKLTEKDAELLRAISHCFELFYTEGRAVPWFKSLLLSLKISAYAFISDFYEWFLLNNYTLPTETEEKYPFAKILKMQERFIQFKLEEKKISYIYPVIEDILRLHAAFSEAIVEGKETELVLHYSPEDTLSPSSFYFLRFYDEVCAEKTAIRVFLTEEGPEYEILPFFT